MEFKQLEAFHAVATEKSFSRAAAVMYLSQPTVSSHIKSLERETGQTLFVRTTKSVTLTAEGEAFLPYVSRMLELKRAAMQEIAHPDRQMIRIAASTIPSAYILPRVLPLFRKEHGNTFFKILQSDSEGVEEMVLDGSYDIGVSGSKPQDERLFARPFCTDTMVFATPATPYYIALRKEKPDLRRLLEEPIIVREKGSGTKKAIDLFLRENGIRVSDLNVVARLNDPEAIKRMIMGGVGTSILSGFATADMESGGRIILYPLKARDPRRFYYMYRKRKKPDHPVMTFIRYLEKTERKGL